MFRICLIIALTIATHLQLSAGASAENKKAVAVQALQTLSFLPFYVAIDKGLFAKHGLDVTTETVSSVNAALGALTSGKAQFSLTASVWPAKAAAKGEPIQLIANCVNGPAVWIVGPQDFDFKDITSLKGQTIITAKMPANTTALLFRYARESGMNPDTDFKLLQVKVGAETAALLTLGDKAKFAVTAEPATDWAVTLGNKVLVAFSKSYGDLAASSVAAHKDIDPDLAQRFVNALQEALVLVAKDPAMAVAVGKNQFPRLPPEVVEAAVRRMIADNLYPKTVDITPDGFKRGLELYLDSKAERPAFEKVVSRAFIEKALASR